MPEGRYNKRIRGPGVHKKHSYPPPALYGKRAKRHDLSQAVKRAMKKRRLCECGNAIALNKPADVVKCAECLEETGIYLPKGAEYERIRKKIQEEWSRETELNRRVGPDNQRHDVEYDRPRRGLKDGHSPGVKE